MKFLNFILFVMFCVSTVFCQVRKLDCEDFNIRGMYVGASDSIFNKIGLAKQLKINAFVIDVRDDFGDITCDLGDSKIKSEKYIKDIKSLLNVLKKNGIYTIARIATFKNKMKKGRTADVPFLIKNKDGSIYFDKEKVSWINPYKKEVQKYILKIAKLAAKAGFDEIQFDYIRFPPFKSLENTEVAEFLKKKSKIELINEFLDFVVPSLHELKIKVSADVFGCVIPETMGILSAESSKNLGQDYMSIASKVDYICPMIYPSHWPIDSFDIKYPDLEPYKIVKKSMEYSNNALKHQSNKTRPWIQAFSATWLKNGIWKEYTIKQVQDQINALRESGIKEFCLWNPSARYNY